MRGLLTGAGSVVGAVAASACCIGPMLAVGLGIGGLGAAARLEVYRPYFLVGTFLMLGSAFYFTYRKDDSCEGEVCVSRTHSIQRTLLWIVAAATLGFAAFPYFLSFL